MFSLVILDGGRPRVLSTATDEATLRRAWGTAKAAIIARGREVVATKPGTGVAALAELRQAVRVGLEGVAYGATERAEVRAPAVTVEPEAEEDDAEPEPEDDEEAEDDPPPPPPRAQKPRPAPSTPTCTRPGCERHTRQATRPGSADPALSVLCDVCKASAYRLMRERGVSAADAVAEMQRTPRGQAPMMKVPAPRPAALRAPAPTPPTSTPPASTPPAAPLGEVLAEAREAMELCRRYGGIATVRTVLETIDGWRAA